MKSYQQINKVQFLPARCQYGRVQSLPIFLIFLSGYRYLSDDGTDQRGILHDGTYWPQTGLLTFWGPGSVPQGIPQIQNFGPKFWPFDWEYRWQKYSGLVLCKSRGNSRVTVSTSRHWKPQKSSMCRWFHSVGQCQVGLGVALAGCDGGLGLGPGGSALLVVGFSVLVSILLR